MSEKSCWWIKEHLHFGFDNFIQACCMSYCDSSGTPRGYVRLVEITGDRFPAREVVEARGRLQASILDNTNDDCRECPALRIQDWKEQTYLANKITMNLWTHCNLKCKYCYTVAPGFEHQKVTYPILSVIGDMLKGKYIDPNGYVTWGGGDISALPEFDDLAKLYLDYGLFQEFKTSGVKYLNGVAWALEQKRGCLEVSVDSGTRKTYASYKGRDLFDTVSENLLRYRQHGDLHLKYIADFCNVGDEDIEGFIGLAREVDPSIITLTAEHGSMWSKKFDDRTVLGMAKLLYRLREEKFTVLPNDDVLGYELFPNYWARIREHIRDGRFAY